VFVQNQSGNATQGQDGMTGDTGNATGLTGNLDIGSIQAQSPYDGGDNKDNN
jgi:hypothetical protein